MDHKELYDLIYNCKCKPWRKGVNYCDNCINAVVNFMNEHGAGVLMRDIELEDLQKENSKLIKENTTLSNKLELKIKRVEELKTLVNGKESSE